MSEELDFIPTKCATLKKASATFQAVVHNSHKKKELKQTTVLKKRSDGIKENNIDMKRFRHEIIKFGMSGLDQQKKEEAKIHLAVKLGARPPKNKYKNYKLLKAEKKNEAESHKEKLMIQQIGKNKVGKSTAVKKTRNQKHKRKKISILDTYGKVSINLGIVR